MKVKLLNTNTINPRILELCGKNFICRNIIIGCSAHLFGDDGEIFSTSRVESTNIYNHILNVKTKNSTYLFEVM